MWYSRRFFPPRARASVPAGRRPHDSYRCCMNPSRKPASLLPGIALLALSATGVHAQQGDQYVCFDTNVGEFCIVLYPDTAPLTVANFLNYVEDGDYDNTIIHRSAPRFVIQGGGYTYDAEEDELVEITSDPAVVNEFSRSNVRGTVAMAKLGNDPNSATNEWFVNLVDNSQNLDYQNGGFTVFGEVIGQGMAVVDAIAGRPIRNLSTLYGGAFDSMPVLKFSTPVSADDFIVVRRAYVSDANNLPPDPDLPDTTGVFNGLTLTVPVQFRDSMLRMTFDLNSEPPTYVFRLRTTQIVELNDKGQERATFDIETGRMHIPTVLYGLDVWQDLELRLTDATLFEVTLDSFTVVPASP